jgi:hypothetical protein
MELPDEVSEKVYHKNAEWIFAQFIGMAKTRDLTMNSHRFEHKNFAKARQIVPAAIVKVQSKPRMQGRRRLLR